MKNIFQKIWHLPQNLMIFVIKLYQNTISPDHKGFLKIFFPYGYCRFQPSCSEYSKQSFQKYGFWKGLMKSIWRIVRCNPWNKGGHEEA